MGAKPIEGPWAVTVAAGPMILNGHKHLYWSVESEEEGACIVVAPIEYDTPEVREERAATAALIASAPSLQERVEELTAALRQACEGYRLREYRGRPSIDRSGFSGGDPAECPELVKFLKEIGVEFEEPYSWINAAAVSPDKEAGAPDA